MAYFKEQETGKAEEYPHRFRSSQTAFSISQDDADDYDDGFDELSEDMSGEEYYDDDFRKDKRKIKFRIAAGVGDFMAVIAGAACIFLLTTLLVSMVRFITSDITQNFTIFAVRF